MSVLNATTRSKKSNVFLFPSGVPVEPTTVPLFAGPSRPTYRIIFKFKNNEQTITYSDAKDSAGLLEYVRLFLTHHIDAADLRSADIQIEHLG